MKSNGSLLILLIILFVHSANLVAQDQIDAGIFESDNPDTLVIKARPNYDLSSPDYITNIQFTIKWSDTSAVTELITISSSVNSSFGIQQQQSANNDGFNYRVYAVVGQKYVNWTAGEEYPILELLVNSPGGDCTEFEISDDQYTINSLNGGLYFEVVGGNRTGIRYEPVVSLSTVGGAVNNDENICLGNSTSVMTLTGQSGDVLNWQQKQDAQPWQDITGTSGLTEYTATPGSTGTYLYRAVVQKGSCSVEYSLPAEILVEDLSRWRGEQDNAWDNTGNWNACGVPDINREVIIPQVPSNIYPVITVSASCKDLIIKDGATVTVEATGSLTIDNASSP